MDISQIVESAWTVTQKPQGVKAYLEGLLAPAEQEGMGATSPEYVSQLRRAVAVSDRATNAAEHMRLMR